MCFVLWKTYFLIYNIYSDKRTENLPLMGSNYGIVILIASYVLFAKKYGPKFMESREPYNLKYFMTFYNAFQVIMNVFLFSKVNWTVFLDLFILAIEIKNYTFLQGIKILIIGNWNYRCEGVEYSNRPIILGVMYLIYGYFINKVIDLLDTVMKNHKKF